MTGLSPRFKAKFCRKGRQKTRPWLGNNTVCSCTVLGERHVLLPISVPETVGSVCGSCEDAVTVPTVLVSGFGSVSFAILSDKPRPKVSRTLLPTKFG